MPGNSSGSEKGEYYNLRKTLTDKENEETVRKNEETLGVDDLRESLSDTNYELASLKYALDEAAIVAITDTKGTITYVNSKFCEISKYPPEELIGQNHRLINSGHHPIEFFQEMYKVIGKGNVWKNQIKNRAKDGSYYWVDTTIVPLKNKSGKVSKYLAIRFDITAQKNTEEQLRDTLQELKNSNRELESFAHIVSHDLREPLRMISSYSTLLERRYKNRLNEEALKFLKFITEGTGRMQQLISGLQSYSSATVKSGALEITDTNALISEVLQDLKLVLEESHVRVITEELPTIKADPVQIRQLFQNLISNAIKYHSDRNPAVYISAEKTKQEVIFTVRDNGIGIEPADHERIFMIFQRSGEFRKYPGAGIGLAICKRIVERHGGKIWVKSHKNEGTAFFFTIPS
ncbi:MAG: sensor histidine kinase [Syntrophothermus sp.]